MIQTFHSISIHARRAGSFTSNIWAFIRTAIVRIYQIGILYVQEVLMDDFEDEMDDDQEGALVADQEGVLVATDGTGDGKVSGWYQEWKEEREWNNESYGD